VPSLERRREKARALPGRIGCIRRNHDHHDHHHHDQHDGHASDEHVYPALAEYTVMASTGG
jgi:hypothetical protein